MDTAQYLKDLAAAEKRQKQTELDQLRAQALTETARQEALIKPAYTQQRQQASVQSQLGAKNFAEFLANRGQTRAGLSSQAELSRQNVLGRQLGEIQTAENTALQNVANQRADIQTQYQSNLTNAFNQIGTDLSKNLYNERLRQQELAREDALRKQEWAREDAKQPKPVNRTITGQVLNRNAIVQAGVLGTRGTNDQMIWSVPNETGGYDKYTYQVGVNPFTGSMSKSVMTNGKYDASKAFSNGYQPNYIGKTTLTRKNVVDQVDVQGLQQNVYKVGKNYYIWNVSKYTPVVQKKGNWVIK